MNGLGGSLPAGLADASLWISFWISLLLFSALLRDTILARLAQYLLVGASMGYLATLAWKHVLWPRLFVPLWTERPVDPMLWLALGLGTLLWVAGFNLMQQPFENSRFRQWLRLLGVLPIGMMVGVALGVGLAGAVQGTLWPQFWRAATIGIPLEANLNVLSTGILTLVITIGVMLHLHGEKNADTPGYIARWLWIWTWIGRRALWLAAGVIFARLVAARLSLAVVRLDDLLLTFRQTGLWNWLQSITRGFWES